MSEQDQINIVGRLTLQASEIRKRQAFLQQEIDLSIKSIETFLTSIHPRVWGKIVPVELPEHAQKYTDLSKLIALTTEQDSLAKDAAELRAKLSQLGIVI